MEDDQPSRYADHFEPSGARLQHREPISSTRAYVVGLTLGFIIGASLVAILVIVVSFFT